MCCLFSTARSSEPPSHLMIHLYRPHSLAAQDFKLGVISLLLVQQDSLAEGIVTVTESTAEEDLERVSAGIICDLVALLGKLLSEQVAGILRREDLVHVEDEDCLEVLICVGGVNYLV
ncbi:hypothetical protein MFIFM68171_00182 [Madurella fahalii]|uniref:Uncharacterized protein n=1 Tax=Madurella fahalii TaxID=1157608 RepID=A0ABQ0FWU1_9PEZI